MQRAASGRDARLRYIPPILATTIARLPDTPDTGRVPRHTTFAVLVVEDEDGVRRGIRRLLQEEGYTVLEAHNGARALEILTDRHGAIIDLVLTDLRMPVMDGRELAAALA